MQRLAVHAPETTETTPAVSDDGRALKLLRQCGRRELTPEQLAAVRALSADLSSQEWVAMLGLARQHGLASLVFTHLAHAGALPLAPTSIASALRNAYCTTLVTNRQLEIERDKVIAVFARYGVEALLLKGVTLAARYYSEIALRPSHDIDVLVRREQVGHCLRALRDMGYAPKAGKGKALDFGVLYYLELDYRNRAGVRVEPHLALARLPEYRAALAVAQVWARAQTIDIRGVAARYLHPWDELWYLSVHYSVPHEASRLIWLVDIAEVVRAQSQASDSTDPGGWDWEGFVGETITHGLAMPVVIALQQARDLLELELPAQVIPALLAAAATPRERQAWLAAHSSSSDIGRLSRHLLSLPGAREKLAFLWGAGIVGMRKVRRYIGMA
ncbi:MAG: nucleotidyltransferase family protein [Ktedonobacterales bacterium]